MRIAYPPLVRVFGTGAPGASVANNALYFDTSTTPYTPYIYAAGAWHAFGAPPGGTNAIALQGTPISPTAPTSGQILQFNGTQWTPTAPSGGPVPAIVQQKSVAGTIGSVTLTTTPVQNNLLFAITCDIGVSESAGTGWNKLQFVSATNDGVGFYWKLAGAAESTTQTPTTSTGTGAVTVFEISAATPSYIFANNTDLTGTAIVASCNATLAEMIIGVACNRSGTVAPSSITGATLLGTAVQGGSRTIQPFFVSSPVKGSNSITANYASSQGAAIPMIEIG